MEHEGKALAADELDHSNHQSPAVVVPLAVYLIVPRLLLAYGKIAASRAVRKG